MPERKPEDNDSQPGIGALIAILILCAALVGIVMWAIRLRDDVAANRQDLIQIRTTVNENNRLLLDIRRHQDQSSQQSK